MLALALPLIAATSLLAGPLIPLSGEDPCSRCKSFLLPGSLEPTAPAPITLEPSGEVFVSLRFMPVGTSSLPFHLSLHHNDSQR